MIVPRRLPPASFRRAPWRNGGGTSEEILGWPPGDERFAWRVALATIEHSGPFSAWPGVDRVFTLIGDERVLLDFDGPRTVPVARGEVVRFRGEDAPGCRLEGGPARAFNLMLRRGRARGDVAIARNRAPAALPMVAGVCYAAAGACRVEGAGAPIDVDEGHALALEAAGASSVLVRVTPVDAGGEAVVAGIEAAS